MRRAIFFLMLLLPAASLAAEDRPSTVTQQLAGRKLTYGTGLGTKFEGLAIALLGSCHAETSFHVGNQEHWDKFLIGDHLLVTFAQPRLFGVTSGEEETVSAREILIPISPSQSPPQILVRDGDRIRAFAKYEHEVCGPAETARKSPAAPAPEAADALICASRVPFTLMARSVRACRWCRRSRCRGRPRSGRRRDDRPTPRDCSDWRGGAS